MYKTIDVTQTIYLYDHALGGYTHKFPTLLDAMKYVASNYSWNYSTDKLENLIINDINMSKDTYKVYSAYDGTEYKEYLRRFTFVDETDRIIDMRNYINEILDLFEREDIKYINLWAKRRKIRIGRKCAIAKSWKDTTKSRKQWARHKKGTLERIPNKWKMEE